VAETELRPNFRALGPAFQADAPRVADALRGLGPDEARELARALAGGQATLVVDGQERALTPEMVAIVERPRTGWNLVHEGGVSVALDVEITPELRLEGLARELVRAVNDLRKEHGLALDARIDLAVEIEPAPVGAEAVVDGGPCGFLLAGRDASCRALLGDAPCDLRV
jgi:isoleucyl-tRNA synthetase